MKKLTTRLTTRTCPVCGGTGKIISKIKRHTYSEKERETARKLLSKGLTYREIAEKMGIDHPQKVYSMIKVFKD